MWNKQRRISLTETTERTEKREDYVTNDCSP